jgi:transcriptional regulator with XRE-family HTH domain
MAGDETRRRELHDFLQAARARLEPEDIGISPGRNRRRAGLHQADVASALGVSGRWYNAFENSAASAAPELLDRLACVLRLTPAERVHLYLLASGQEPPPVTVEPHRQDRSGRAALERLVKLAGPDLPALLCDVAWNMLTWNDTLAQRVLDPAGLPRPARNLILWLFSPGAANAISDIAAVRDEEVGHVHGALARYPGDPQLEHLARRLMQIPAARKLWQRQQIPDATLITTRRIRAGQAGSATGADLISAEFPETGRQRLLIFVPRGDWPAGAGTPPASTPAPAVLAVRTRRPAPAGHLSARQMPGPATGAR